MKWGVSWTPSGIAFFWCDQNLTGPKALHCLHRAARAVTVALDGSTVSCYIVNRLQGQAQVLALFTGTEPLVQEEG